MLARFRAIASRAAPPRLRQFPHFFSLSPRCFLCLPREGSRPHIQYSCGFAGCGLGIATAVPAATEKQEGKKTARRRRLARGYRCHADGKSTLIWSFHAVGHGQRINCSSAVSDVPANCSTTAGASKASRIRRRTCVTLISSASAISSTDPTRCSSSNRCQ